MDDPAGAREASPAPDDAPDTTLSSSQLAFADPALEQAFRAEWDRSSMGYLRVGFRVGLLLFVAFGLFDLLMAPEAIVPILAVRAAVCGWIVVAARLAPRALERGRLQALLAVTGAVAGLAIVAMTVLADDRGAGTPYAGLLLVIVATATIIRLRLGPALVVVGVLDLAYPASLVLDPGLPALVAVNNVVFVIATSGVSLVATYLLERAGRAAFAQQAVAAARTSSLTEALANVRELTGLIPVCAWCHKVRDDDGYWRKLESYVAARSHATFSHGMCPDCFAQYGEGDAEVAPST